MSTWRGQHPQPGAARLGQRVGEAVGLRGRGQRLAVRGHGLRRIGQDRRRAHRPSAAAATTPADRPGPPTGRTPGPGHRPAGPSWRSRAAATHSSPSGSRREQVDRVLGEHVHSRRTSASATPRCRRCAARSRSAGRPPTGHHAGAASRAAATAATSAAAEGSCPSCILVHARSSRCRWPEHRVVGRRLRTARPITLRARTASPPCSAARVTSAGGAVRHRHRTRASGADGLTQPGGRDRVGPVQRQQQALGQAAGGARGRGRWARVRGFRPPSRASAAWPAATNTITPAAPTVASPRYPAPRPASEQFGGLAGVAVVGGDAGGDAHRGRPAARGRTSPTVCRPVPRRTHSRRRVPARRRGGSPARLRRRRRSGRPAATVPSRRGAGRAPRVLRAPRPGADHATRARPVPAPNLLTAWISRSACAAARIRSRGVGRRR